MDAYDISSSALTAQRLRMDVIASNLANVNTTKDAKGNYAPYRRKQVIFAPILDDQMNGNGGQSTSVSMKLGKTPIKPMMQADGTPLFHAGISQDTEFKGSGVKVVSVIDDTQTPLRRQYDPGNPDADENGMVSMPNVNPVTEMVDMIAASRAYEANVSALQGTKAMGKAALEI